MKSWECIFLHMEGRLLKLVGNREDVIQSNPIILPQRERSNAGSRSDVFGDRARLSLNTVHRTMGAPSPGLNHFSVQRNETLRLAKPGSSTHPSDQWSACLSR